VTMLQGTLLQLHYHNRPGGVSTVMNSYAQSFKRLCGNGNSRNIILCHVDESVGQAPSIQYASVVDCDYRTFKSKKTFLQIKKKLYQTIVHIMADPTLPRPVYMVGHNLNLGKNIALSAAFAELCLEMVNNHDFRFFSVIHDFAEQGRTDLLLAIRNLEKSGISVWRYLYPRAESLRYICINPLFFKLMEQSGFSVSFLPNQSRRELRHNGKVSGHRGLSKQKLFKLAHNVLDANKPVCLYPVRLISRKNPVEAIIISHFFCHVNLLFGGTGTSLQDSSLSSVLQDICKKYSVPVLFNSFQLSKKIGESSNKDEFFQIANCCISTSLAEGFGYALHDPIHYNRPLIARQPLGIASSKRFYKRFYIPLAWVDEEKIICQYYKVHSMILGITTGVQDYALFAALFRKTFTTDIGIDFGCLDISTQIAVLKYCLIHSDAVAVWKKMFPAQTRFLQSSMVTRQKKQIGPSISNTDDAFMGCLKTKSNKKRKYQDPLGILGYFGEVSHFYLLLNPQKPDLQKNNAVFA
jgi:hypothetical protein